MELDKPSVALAKEGRGNARERNEGMDKLPLVPCLANTVAANFTANWASAKARRLGSFKALLAELRHWRS